MCAAYDDDIDDIVRQIIAERRDPTIAVLSIAVAVAALVEVERSPALMRRAALAGLRGRARELMGLSGRPETVAEAAQRLRGRRRNR